MQSSILKSSRKNTVPLIPFLIDWLTEGRAFWIIEQTLFKQQEHTPELDL